MEHNNNIKVRRRGCLSESILTFPLIMSITAVLQSPSVGFIDAFSSRISPSGVHRPSLMFSTCGLKNDPGFSWQKEATGLSLSGQPQQCSGCGSTISDRFLLQVSGVTWHAKCLRCSSCHVSLEAETLCYLRNSQVFCRSDYQRLVHDIQFPRLFGSKL